MDPDEFGHWRDKFDRLCALPPAGVALNLPWSIRASSSANSLQRLKNNPDESSKFSVGIWFNRHIGLYEARLRINGKRIHAGSFKTIGEAEAAREELIESLKEK